MREEYELRYWTDKFGVSAGKLRATVGKVGVSVVAVERELER